MRPRPHRLAYRVFSLLADLEELPALGRRLKLFSHNRWNLFSFYDRDHGDHSGRPLRSWVDAQLRNAGIALHGGSVKMLCFPRVLGYAFNPLTVYFCYRADGTVAAEFKELEVSDLPEGDVTLATEYSTLNYKDGMILNGIGRLVRSYPHVPGVDLAGTVEASEHPDFRPGDKVICTGWRLGELHWGGYAQKARVKGDWLVKLPDGLTTRQAMAVGTAGLSSMLSVMALEDHGLTPDQAPVLVTGAAGGVGSTAVASAAPSPLPARPSTRSGGSTPARPPTTRRPCPGSSERWTPCARRSPRHASCRRRARSSARSPTRGGWSPRASASSA